ncbi:uncharacterized protein N7482_006344 [Penicillium canariense]|uniref:Uncharacterized protein n=1 Tax=Penicillium canariense TaxID=189055 RepID=A0A9W9I695_9EURO|nr:uncharacterized protein N7482_006344 [Penicillium canariense]KAJ5167563.1 hypothetical protein N7482_006344 [Penicillium canariense]
MALSKCDAVVNPPFESGVLFPWIPSAMNVAKVNNGTSASSGDYYVDLQTAVGNRGNTISQSLKHLEPRTEYMFGV